MTKSSSRPCLICILLALALLFVLVFTVKLSPQNHLPANTTPITNLPSENQIPSPENNPTQPFSTPGSHPTEQPVITISLAGPVAESRSEISALAWYGDYLLLIPQYPARFGPDDGVIFGLEKQDILAYLDGISTEPLTPIEIQFSAPGISRIDGFQGYEAIAVDGESVFMTIEANPGDMLGYLIRGTIDTEMSRLSLDPASLEAIQPPVQIENMAYEAVLVTPDQVLTFFEANGENTSPSLYAQSFSRNGDSTGTVPMTTLEYRLTDVTTLDSKSQFWGINYFYPGDTKLNPENDALVDQYGEGSTHAQNTTVERLVLFQYTDDAITLVLVPPIQLQLLGDDQARNWEGIARLDERGFLLATDKYPNTILAFVELP